MLNQFSVESYTHNSRAIDLARSVIFRKKCQFMNTRANTHSCTKKQTFRFEFLFYFILLWFNICRPECAAKTMENVFGVQRIDAKFQCELQAAREIFSEWKHYYWQLHMPEKQTYQIVFGLILIKGFGRNLAIGVRNFSLKNRKDPYGV